MICRSTSWNHLMCAPQEGCAPRKGTAMTLRRTENVSVLWKGGLLGLLGFKGRVYVSVGKTQYQSFKCTKSEFELGRASQETMPWQIMALKERNYWVFQGRYYTENEDLSQQQVHALLVTRDQRSKQRVDQAVATVAMGSSAQQRAASRGVIPDEVRQYVWTRDEGRCRHCGRTSELQFDHVIPVSKGGSSEANNLQILCGPCNRRKGSGLTSGFNIQGTFSTENSAPANWYDDPDDPSQMRYWDGSKWTGHRAPKTS